jgi:hypothetical protein
MEEINLEKRLNENIIEKLRSSVQDLRSFIELDAEIKESNLKEIENMNILGNLFIFFNNNKGVYRYVIYKSWNFMICILILYRSCVKIILLV